MRLVALAWAIASAACSAGYGFSIEANGGMVRLSPDGDAASETAITAGLTAALEFEWLRDADLGAGFGWQTLRVDDPSDDPGAGVSSTPMHIWFGSAIGNAGWRTRPHVTMGGSLANGEGDLYADGYAALGVSFHPARGRALHVAFGPQIVRAGDERALSATRTYQGWGAQARVRFFRMSNRGCDPATREEAIEKVSTRGEWSCR